MAHLQIVFTVILACVISVASKPVFQQTCRELRNEGCSSELKRTGRVCGTDGNTYRNACFLRLKACRLRYTLQIAYRGRCDEEDGEEEGKRPTYLGAQNNPTQQDSSSSSEEEDTAMGGDGETGDGEGVPTIAPTLRATTGGVPLPVTDGAAGGGNVPIPPATTVRAEPVGTTLVPEAPGVPITDADVLPPLGGGEPQAKTCVKKCPEAQPFDVVCGTDNLQYPSLCHLTQYACLVKDTISILHRGYCNNSCEFQCPRVYEPVCGTDNVTYKFSRCDLERTACLIRDETLQVAYNGECDEAEPLAGCTPCDQIAEPVCSSNNITFRSECEFNRYMCFYQDSNIELASNDSCSNAPLVCPNFCEPIDDPVCGDNGVTYPNVCELGLADCNARNVNPPSGIQFVSFGECIETTAADPCSRNSLSCDLEEAPVCAMVGTTMESFYNKCFFDKEACFDPTIQLIGEGLCPPALEFPNPENQPYIQPIQSNTASIMYALAMSGTL